MNEFLGLSDVELADQITTWAGRIAAGEAKLLALIGEFDSRGAWSGPGTLSCAHWLSWRLGMGLVAARERVRVAHRLRELPLTAQAFAAGRLSWTQVRALTRCAGPDTEADLVDLARHCTGAQLERVARGLRQVQENERRAVDPDAAELAMRCTKRYDVDGTLVLTLRVPPAHAPTVLAGLERMQAEIQAERDALTGELAAGASAEAPTGPSSVVADWNRERTEAAAVRAEAHRTGAEVRPATWGDALVRMAGRALDAPSPAPLPVSRLRLEIDPLSGWARTKDGEFLPPSSMRQVLRTLPGRDMKCRPLTPGDLTRHDLGRSSRLVSGPLRSLLGTLDGEKCRFPSCSRVTKLHAHHVVFWRSNGRTDLGNLVLVCSRHHTLIHQYGFQLVLSPDRTLTVRTKEDIPVVHRPELPWEPAEGLDLHERITEDTLPPTWNGESLDLGYVVAVLLHQPRDASAEAPAA